MSGPPSEQTIEELQYDFRLNCINYACVALLIYYVALNLPPDIRRLWGRRSIATLLSAINWFAIIGTIITNTPLPANTIQRCASSDYAYEVVLLVVTTVSPLVATLRVHAVSGGNWRWVLPVSLLGVVHVGLKIWAMTKEIALIVPPFGCIIIFDINYVISLVVPDILVVVATWYYISRTSSMRTQLVHDMWTARPNLITVMFRHGTSYFLTISLPNVADLVAISSSDIAVDISYLTAVMSSILVSHFLICIREAAERSTQALSSRSLSFIDSQGNSVSRSWLSSIEFAADIANPSARGSGVNAFSDLEDDLDSRGEDDSGDASNDGVELEEYLASVRSVDARTS